MPKIKAAAARSKFSPAAVALLFISGAVALVYEVIWQRQFALVLGSNGAATAAVLASFFAGLGLGSWLLGSRAQRWKNPLAAFATLELGVGLGALLVSPLLKAGESFYPHLFERFSNSPFLFTSIKLLLAFSALALPTICMGGTIPVLGDFAVQLDKRLGISAGLLYAVNTCGAALGALAVPFFLLPQLSLEQITWGAVSCNALIATLALAFSRKLFVSGHSPPVASSEKLRTLPLLLSALSGFVTFALQVTWNRAFGQVHENSIYSFAVITATFIAALALGAQVARIILNRQHLPAFKLLGCAWIAGGLLTFIAPWLFLKLTHNLSYIGSTGGWASYGFQLLKLSLATLALPTVALGMAVPLLMESSGPGGPGTASKALGHLLGINIIGTVAGALAGGFVFPKLLGLWGSIISLGLFVALVGTWQVTSSLSPNLRTIRRLSAFVIAVVLSCLATLTPLPRVKIATGEHLLHITEGLHGTVAVVERPNSRRLKLNNYYVLGGTASVGDERMQAHLPLLLHPAPSRVAFLGVGTAITASGALFHLLSEITLVELVPEVLDLARLYFNEANGAILQNPRARVIPDDARNFLRGTGGKFDVIISDLVVPWRQGEGALYTLEHFAAASRCLAPGGLFCVWVPCFQVSKQEIEIILRTFLNVFPEAALFRGDFSPNQPALALVGTAGSPKLDWTHLESRLKNFTDPANPHLSDPTAFWMHFAGAVDRSWPAFGTSNLNSESRPRIELLGPLEHAGGRTTVLVTGTNLLDWLATIAPLPSTAKYLNAPAQRSGHGAGTLLAKFTLLLSQGRNNEALQLQSELKSALPESVYSKLFP